MHSDEDDRFEVEEDDGKPVYMLPRWVLIAIVVLTLVALLASELSGLFMQAPTPPPMPTPPMSAI